jgi:hypothetical protein
MRVVPSILPIKATAWELRGETEHIWVLKLVLEKKGTLVRLEFGTLYARKWRMTAKRSPGEAARVWAL